MKEKDYARYSQERKNYRLGNILLIKADINLVLDHLVIDSMITNQMSYDERIFYHDKLETIKKICDFYGDPDFSMLGKKDLLLISQKYLSLSNLQIKSLTNALLYNLIYFILKTNRQLNPNPYINKVKILFGNKKMNDLVNNEEILEKTIEEIENNTYVKNTLKKILQPFIDRLELPSLTNNLLELSYENKEGILDKLNKESVQKWINKNPVPDSEKGWDYIFFGINVAGTNFSDIYFEQKEKLISYLIRDEPFKTLIND